MSQKDDYMLPGQMSIFDCFSQDLWSGKMSPEPSVPTAEKISEPSSKKRQGLSVKMPLFLDLRGVGVQAAASWETGGVLLGAYTMRSFGEYPSEEKESRLSQILEVNPLQKYSLSAKACQGILRRAQRRGKKLPELLEKTLIQQSACKETELTEQIPQDATGADGEGGGCYTLNTIDRPAVCAVQTYQQTTDPLMASGYQKNGTQEAMNGMYVVGTAYDGSQVSPTLTANNADGSQRMPDKDNFNAVVTYGLDRASFNQGQNAQYDFSVIEEQAQTLISRGPGGVLTEQ